MSLNFLTIFKISQPYLIVIVIFLLLRNSKISLSSILLVFFGAIFDIITGTNLGIHSLFFLLIKVFIEIYEIKFKISNKFGEWILFSLVYFSSLVITKFVFILLTLKIPDVFSILFNLGSTLLIFPIIQFLINLPKIFFNLVSK